MSRSLTNFILFEDLLDNLDSTNKNLTTLANQLFAPYVEVIQEDCKTKLGKRISVSPGVNGLVRIDFNVTLNPDRTIPDSYRISKSDIELWLANSIYTTYVRDLHYCTATGGICASCYASTFNVAAPKVGSLVQVKNQYVLSSDSYLTTSGSTVFAITADEGTYDSVTVYLDNQVLTDSQFSVVDNSVVLTDDPGFGNYLTINTVLVSNKPFMSYLADSYSGSVVGIKSIINQPITLPTGVVDRAINNNQLKNLYDQAEQLGLIDQVQLDYYNSLTNKVEKALLLITLYTIYNDISA